MYKFWYDYITDNFIVCIKADNIYKDISEDIETRFEIENYELDRPLSKGKNKKSNSINEI